MIAEPLRIYLDACCLNRPFDDQRHDLIRMEAEAVTRVFRKSDQGVYLWVSSQVLLFEIKNTRDVDRRMNLLELETRADERVPFHRDHIELAEYWTQGGIKLIDALHLVAAKIGKVAVFLTTDRKLLTKARDTQQSAGFRVENPLSFLLGEKKHA